MKQAITNNQQLHTNNKELNNPYYTTLYQNYKQLGYFHSINISYLIGRGYYNLQQNYRLTVEQIGECFGTTGANVARTINVYLKYKNNGKALC